jgi:hypothetical protein
MLSIRVRGPKDTITLSLPVSTTYAELKEQIKSKLFLQKEFDLLCGFPPKVIELADDAVIDEHIQNNDSLRVQLSELAGHQAVATPKKSKSKSPAKSGGSSSSFGSLVPFANRVASLSNPKGTRKTSSSLKSSAVSAAGKRRAPRRSAGQSSSSTGSGEGDLCEHLLEAVSAGSTGNRNKVLRKVFRDAISFQYNESKAISRLHAVYSRNYQIKEKENIRYLGTGISTMIDIRFHRGVGSRTYFEESVDLIPKELLIPLLKLAIDDKEGNGKEVLKPMNLSKSSPRLFWSLIYHYGIDLIGTMKMLLKNYDSCEWLTERKRELSEKAKENFMQKQLEEEEKQSKKRRKGQKGKSIDVHDEEKGEVEKNSQLVDLSKEEDIEQDGKEKTSKIKPFRSALFTFLSQIPFSGLLPKEYEEIMMKYYHSSSSYSSSSSSNSANSSSPLLFLADFEITSENLQNLNSCSSSSSLSIYEDQLESWILSAQQQIYEVFWSQLCGGGSERLFKAYEKAKITVLTEFLRWETSPNGLLQFLLSLDPSLDEIHYFWHPSIVSFVKPSVVSSVSSSSSSSTVTGKVGMEDVTKTLTNDTFAALMKFAQEFRSCFLWTKGLCDILLERIKDDKEEEHDEQVNDDKGTNNTEEEKGTNWDDEWLFTADAHEFIYKECRIFVRFGSENNEEKDEDEEEKEEEEVEADEAAEVSMVTNLWKCNYWEDGICIGYLPPTDEEPMALWRIKLDENPKEKKLPLKSKGDDLKEGRFEDMEYEEILQAMSLYEVLA